jgi:hypothetical protein
MFQSLKEIILNIFSEINTIPEEAPVLIYVGVGTFAGLMEDSNHGKYLAEGNYHQYPPFVKSLKREIKDLHLYIVLIDPMQENPPYMITDEKLEENFSQIREDKFKSQDKRITTYVLRKNVTFDTYINPKHKDIDADKDERYKVHNISEDMNFLNHKCIENTYSLLYHDYSGRQVKYVAQQYDSSLRMYLDRIVYGFNSREDTGCYFNMCKPDAFLPYRIKFNRHRKSLKFFNIYKYIVCKKYEKIDEAIDAYEERFIEMILNQRYKILDNICSDFTNFNLAILRSLHKKINGEDLKIYEGHFYSLPKDLKVRIMQMLTMEEYSEMFETLLEHYSKEIAIVAILKQLDVSGLSLLNSIISNPNPYLWINEMKQLISS